MMTDFEKNIIALIRSALLGTSGEMSTQPDWKAVLDFSVRHSIVPTIAEGLPLEQMEPEIRQEFAKPALVNYRMYLNQTAWLQKIRKKFLENNIDFMPLKGSALCSLYPKPEMRVMGDLDILIRMEQYPQVRRCMQELGLYEGQETDHELVWRQKHLYIELHKNLMPSYNRDFHSYLGSGWSLAHRIGETTEYCMEPEDEFVYIFVHFAKHYRDGGIGFRHILDLYLYLKKRQPDMACICAKLQELGLLDFFENVDATLRCWFEDGKSTRITQTITRRIFGSGAYGSEQGCDAAHALRTRNRTGSAERARRETIRTQLFLPLSVMKIRYPVLEKKPCLLPVMWAVRWYDAAFVESSGAKMKLRRLHSMTDEVINAYSQELELVGLNTEF